jgi:hypothetical protein
MKLKVRTPRIIERPFMAAASKHSSPISESLPKIHSSPEVFAQGGQSGPALRTTPGPKIPGRL